MDFYSFQMALAIVVLLVTILMYWLASLVEKPEPNDDRESVDLDSSASPLSSAESSSAPMVVEKPEPTPSASLLSAPSSSSTAPRWKYDVFLSFRGPVTRRSITSDLYHRLHNVRGISTFMDDSALEVGDPISPTLLKAIEDSRFAIVVLSPNYASSTWCLEELTKICECMKDNNRILPLFYNVVPSHVRYPKMGTSFGEAFRKHERSERHSSDKVQQWKDALNKVASFSGWDANNFQTDRELVDAIMDFVCTKVPPIDTEFTISMGDFGVYEATREAMVEVMKALKDDDVTAVGVYSMGGVGKTTMVEHVGAEACKKRIFDHLIMAVVSQIPDIASIRQRLSKEIMGKKNILIILDDIWSFIDLSRIGIPSPDKLKQRNSKVLLTTRSLHVCNLLSCQASIPLNTLSEPDSWSLFVKNTQRFFECGEFEDVAKRVAGECRGLPIALIAVARALGDKNLVEWKKAALQLKKSQIANPDHEDDAFKCLKVSYDYLKDEDYKSCFLLCCLFPEDSDIPIEDLFKYAIGKGLFQDTDTIYEARGIADSVVKHLIDSSLLLDGVERCVRMHDVVRDTAMRIAKIEDGGNGFLVRAGCGLNDWSCRSHEGYSAISLMQNNIRSLPKQLVAPNLQILLLNHNYDLNEIPEKFIQSLNELRVLDLSFTDISLLPHQSFSLLTNLQALYLDYCEETIDISVIGKLKKLEILSMRAYPLKELSREIELLTSLRMLDVSSHGATEGSIVTIPSGVISKLHRLEELYMIGCGFKNWGCQIQGEGEETNTGFGEIAGLPKMKILQVSLYGVECIPENVEVEPGWVCFDIRIGRLTTAESYRFDSNSRSLCLSETTAAMSTLPDWFVNVVTSKTERLEYYLCKGMSDIVKEFDHGRLYELKHLTVVGDYLDESYVYMEELMNTTGRVQKGPVFEKLEELHLRYLAHLKELCVGELPPRSLSNVRVLHMDHCYILKNVSEFVQRLPNLEKLYLKDVREMKYVFGWEGFEPKQSKLREIHLEGLDSVKSICSGPAPRVIFHTLRSMTIYQCFELQSLLASDVAECLVQLEDLFVEDCPLLERVIEAVKNEKTVLPKLNNLVLKDLSKLYGESATADIECPSLENLIVVDCSQFPFSTTSEAFEKISNEFSFSSSASDYFGSTNPVKLNDPQLYYSIESTPLSSSAPMVVEKPEPTPSASLLSAPSSSSTAHRWKYDVFLSFRGPVTRRSITSDLYHRLHNVRGISTFMDDSDLEVGDPISPILLKAIEDSRFAIVVLFPNYASSTWCLEELTKICECMKDNNRILPLFYNVEPSHVRHLKGSFGEAFYMHGRSERHNSDKVQQWKDALNKVASFSGWDANNFQTDRELVDAIVDFVCTKVPPIDTGFTMSMGHFEPFKATRKAMVEVMKALKDDDVTAVGVYGMGGVGKTTMVEHVGAEACKKRIFYHLIMAVVSQSHDIERIQQRLLAKLLGHENFTESGRASRLYEEMMRTKNILIILDDIWSFIDLSRIGIPSHDELKKCNSKVLFTTRKLHVCSSMRTQESICLDILSEQDSWSLFLKKTEISFESNDFENVAKRVARECKGLPVSLIAVARALRDKDLVEWQKAAQQLKKSQIPNPDHDDDAFECLKLSYDYLKNEDYKSCFLLCCLFPEDSDIPIEDLFKYAIGKGLFQDTDTIYEARGIADSVVKHLIDSSLLLDGVERCVRMHDVVRDTAMRIAKIEDGGNGFLVRAGCGLNDWSCRSHEGYSAISLMQNNIRSLPKQLVAPNLQILLLNHNYDLNEIPEKFIQSLNELRVLDLSFTDISLLPHQSFSLLTNLQALYLDYCEETIDISVIGKLKKLEILSMRAYPLKELSREIELLTSLRMLDVSSHGATEGSIVTIPSGVISKLHRLEELYMIGCGFKNWGCQIQGEGEETNTGFGEIAGLPKMKILQVSLYGVECIPENVEVEPGWVCFDIRIGRLTTAESYRFDSNSRSLCLSETTAAMSTLPDWFVNAVTSKTEKLEYYLCKGMSDIVKEFDHGRLHELKHFTVTGDWDKSYVYMEELMNTTRRVQKGPVFEKLEELHLISLRHLKELCVGELPPRSLSNLKVLHMKDCKILKNVSKFVQRLPNLEKLYLTGMEELEYVFGWEGFEPKQSKVTRMHLSYLHSMKSICSGPAPRVIFQCLKTLSFCYCYGLQSLFTSDVAECLVQLEDLFVEDCPLLERVIEAVKNEKTVLPKLKNLVLKDLPKLYGESATADIECPLENLIVVDCSQFPFSTTWVALERSRNQFSFSSYASDYFGSTNPVKLNDQQLYSSIESTHCWRY